MGMIDTIAEGLGWSTEATRWAVFAVCVVLIIVVVALVICVLQPIFNCAVCAARVLTVDCCCCCCTKGPSAPSGRHSRWDQLRGGGGGYMPVETQLRLMMERQARQGATV